jgi:hypothetical protein
MSGSSMGQTKDNMIFPSLQGITATGKVYSLPEDIKGKFALIGMAYSIKAEKELESWLNPVFNKFIAKTGLFDEFFDIHVLFIPMFTGANQGAFAAAVRKFKESAKSEIKDNVIFYKGDVSKFRSELGLEKEKPYIFLIDENGKIVFKTEGNYTDEKMELIEDKLIN